MAAFERLPMADGLWRRLTIPLRCLADQSVSPAPVLGADGLATRLSAMVIRAGRVVWLGPDDALPADAASLPVHDGGAALTTPGLIDCHTHLVYGGQRANEFAMRLAGADYEAIAKAGGGIVSTVQATRQTGEDLLFRQAAARLEQLLADGVCAIEIKSGYGLSLSDERKQLRVARRLGEVYGVTVRTTFLGAHALPPEFEGRPDAYLDEVCETMLPALAADGLVDAVDVFCERIAFTLAQTERVFVAARALGLPVKLHAEQLSDMGGAALAASYQALSCDHLEHLSAAGIDAMHRAGTVAVLLPGAYYALRDTHLPPIDALRAAGVPIALSTDHNPGTSPALSLLLMMNMGCTLFRLTVPEVIDAVTRHAARALGLQATHGALRVGVTANFVLWQASEPAELAYWFGRRAARVIVRGGRIADADALHTASASPELARCHAGGALVR